MQYFATKVLQKMHIRKKSEQYHKKIIDFNLFVQFSSHNSVKV